MTKAAFEGHLSVYGIFEKDYSFEREKESERASARARAEGRVEGEGEEDSPLSRDPDQGLHPRVPES